MEQIVRAALAPANPSSADRQIAARAKIVAERARAELAQQRYERVQALLEEKSQPAVLEGATSAADYGQRRLRLPSHSLTA